MKHISIVSLLLLIAVPAVGIASLFCNWNIVLFYACAGITLLGSLGEWVSDKLSFVCAIICVVVCVIAMHEPIIVEIAVGIMAASIASEVIGFAKRSVASR